MLLCCMSEVIIGQFVFMIESVTQNEIPNVLPCNRSWWVLPSPFPPSCRISASRYVISKWGKCAQLALQMLSPNSKKRLKSNYTDRPLCLQAQHPWVSWNLPHCLQTRDDAGCNKTPIAKHARLRQALSLPSTTFQAPTLIAVFLSRTFSNGGEVIFSRSLSSQTKKTSRQNGILTDCSFINCFAPHLMIPEAASEDRKAAVTWSNLAQLAVPYSGKTDSGHLKLPICGANSSFCPVIKSFQYGSWIMTTSQHDSNIIK